MVLNALPANVRRIWQVVLDFVLALLCIILCVIGFQITQSNFLNGVIISDFLSTPQWILMICVPVGSFFTAVEAVRQGIRGLLGKTSEDTEKEAQA